MVSTYSKASVLILALAFYWDLVNVFTLLFILFSLHLMLFNFCFFCVFVAAEWVFISFPLTKQTKYLASIHTDMVLWK